MRCGCCEPVTASACGGTGTGTTPAGRAEGSERCGCAYCCTAVAEAAAEVDGASSTGPAAGDAGGAGDAMMPSAPEWKREKSTDEESGCPTGTLAAGASSWCS